MGLVTREYGRLGETGVEAYVEIRTGQVGRWSFCGN